MAVLVLKPGAERRLTAGHPWVYRGEVADVQGRFMPGDVVDVVDAARRRIGRGFYNPRPSLVCRLLAREGDRLDAGLFRERLRAALAFRRRAAAPAGAPFRLCWSEADGLPGLVADRYGPVTVIQCLTLGMARHAEWVLAALEDLFPGDPVFRGDDPTAARLEGFVPQHGWIGPAPRE